MVRICKACGSEDIKIRWVDTNKLNLFFCVAELLKRFDDPPGPRPSQWMECKCLKCKNKWYEDCK